MKKVLRHLGLAIGLAGLVFVTFEITRSWTAVAEAASRANHAGVIAGLALGCVGMVVLALGWRKSLDLLGARIPALDALYRYFVGELGKYVPGGVWSVLGRSEMARKAGTSGVTSYVGTILSLSTAYLAAVAVGSLALIGGGASGARNVWLPAVGLLPIGLVALHPRILEPALSFLKRLSRLDIELQVPSWGESVGLVIRQLPAWLAIGAATWIIAFSLDEPSPGLTDILFATTVSWIAGLLALPVPGGIGVREAVFVSVATTLSSTGIAAAVALTARLVFVTVDLLAAGLFAVLKRRQMLGMS